MFPLIRKLLFPQIYKANEIDISVKIKNKFNLEIGENCRIGEYAIINCSQKKGIKLSISDNVWIKPKAYISGDVRIEEFCGLGHNSWIGGRGTVHIKRNTLIGMNTVVISDDHDYRNVSEPYYDSPLIVSATVIGRNCWIGANCVILNGASIGDNCTIGAGCVIKGTIPSNSVIKNKNHYEINTAANNA